MQDIAFATLLFVAYFCTACCFCYSPSPKNSNLTTTESVPLEPTENEEFIEDLWEPEESITLTQALSAEFDPANQEPTLEELLCEIDIDSLQLQPARKICGKLGIQQKVNGKDAPLSWLQSQIKSRLTEKPTEVVSVIQKVLEAA